MRALFCLLLLAHAASAQSLLDSMTATVEKNVYTGINSIVISKNGQLVYEHYFNGWSRDSLHNARSSFKSVTSLLAGIAIDKGFIKNVNQKVYSYFPEYPTLSGEPLRKEMTLRNLLDMESGFDCEEFNDRKDCESVMDTTDDWVQFSLGLPMKDPPGMVWAYTSCDPMIVGDIIRRSTKMSVMDWARRYLFEPMGIRRYRWTADPAGHGMTAGSFYMRSLDMLRLGEMVLNDGVYNGRRIVSRSWLEASTCTPIPIPDFSFMRLARSDIASPQQAYYGCYWYSEVVKTPRFQEKVLFASGNGGQYILIMKDLGLVVVFTQENYNSWKAKRAFDILARYILPYYLIRDSDKHS